MKNTFVKVSLFAAFMFGVVGACLLFSGYSVYQSASKLDNDWESVTLEQWLDGERSNKSLFEVSEFRTADEYYYVEDRRSADYSIAYIPLYLPNVAEDDGTRVQVVAGVRHAKNDNELWQILEQPTIKIQAYGDRPPLYAKELSTIYPEINWDTVHWVLVDDILPTISGAWTWLAIGATLVFLAFGCLAFAMSLWLRTYSANRQGFSSASQKLESVKDGNKSELDRSALAEYAEAAGGIARYAFPILIFFNAGIALAARRGILDMDVTTSILCFTAHCLSCLACSQFSQYFSLDRVWKLTDASVKNCRLLYDIELSKNLMTSWRMVFR